MQQNANFSVRYLTEDRVPIRDIIDSLQGVESIMSEMASFLPSVVDGLTVRKLDIKVAEIAQESPLRELFLLTLLLGFQEQLKTEVAAGIHEATGYTVPHNLEAIITVLAMVLVFYGVGAIKDLVTGGRDDGPSKRMLDGLLEELALNTGKPAKLLRELLDERYSDKTRWKKIANATARFFTPSKKQDSAPMEVNNRAIDRETVRDVPAQYVWEHEAEVRAARNFPGAILELHAQDRDHQGKGWAAIAKGISDDRLRLRLMEDVSPDELWGADTVKGDITVIYERVGSENIPKEIHLHNITG